MCCLKYEQDAYEDLIRSSPKLESFVDTPEGRGTVVELDLLRQRVKVRMEERPEITGMFSNDEIAVLRNGKTKKNDPPIPADLAPISGKGKRVRESEKQESTFLDPIRFRYSTESIVDEPEQVVQEEPIAETESQQKTKRRKNRKPKQQDAPQQSADLGQEKKAEQKKKPTKKIESNAPQAEDGELKKHRHHHYRRRRPKSNNGDKSNN